MLAVRAIQVCFCWHERVWRSWHNCGVVISISPHAKIILLWDVVSCRIMRCFLSCPYCQSCWGQNGRVEHLASFRSSFDVEKWASWTLGLASAPSLYFVHCRLSVLLLWLKVRRFYLFGAGHKNDHVLWVVQLWIWLKDDKTDGVIT